jgi:release factor glutamine methyltransferase
MPTKKQLNYQTQRQREMINFFRSVPKKGWRIEYMGKYFYVFPNVFMPNWDTIPLFKNWKIKRNAKLLDLGTGSGIIAIMSKYAGAGKVLAVDINPDALKAAKFNVRFHKFGKSIRVIKSNLFDNVNKNEKFDIIVANIPWRKIPTKNVIEKSMWDDDMSVNKRFFDQVNNFLKPSGKIYFLQANFGEMKDIRKLIKKSGFVIKKTFAERDGWKIFYAFELVKR